MEVNAEADIFLGAERVDIFMNSFFAESINHRAIAELKPSCLSGMPSELAVYNTLIVSNIGAVAVPVLFAIMTPLRSATYKLPDLSKAAVVGLLNFVEDNVAPSTAGISL